MDEHSITFKADERVGSSGGLPVGVRGHTRHTSLSLVGRSDAPQRFTKLLPKPVGSKVVSSFKVLIKVLSVASVLFKASSTLISC